MESGLIAGLEDKNGLYKTTERGIEYLNSFKQISQLLESDN